MPLRLFTMLAVLLAAVGGQVAAQATKLEYPAYSGPKKRLAVAGFEDKSGLLPGVNLGSGFSEMLTTALTRTNRFIVLERQALGDLVNEQNLAAAGLMNPETAPTRGRITGAQLIVRGAITEYQEQVETQQQGGGVNVGTFTRTMGISTGRRTGDRVLRSTSVGGGRASSSAHMAIDLRVIDAETGQVVFSDSVVGRADDRASGFDIGIAGISFGQSQSTSDPRQAVVRSCIYRAVEAILAGEAATPWRTSVSQIREGQVYVSAGADEQLRPGDRLLVESKGEAITDPDTGEVLGTEGGSVAILEVREVQARFSIARVAAGKADEIKRGDKVRFATRADLAAVGMSGTAGASRVAGQVLDSRDVGIPDVRVAVPAFGVFVESGPDGRFDLSGKGITGTQVVTFQKGEFLPRSKEVNFDQSEPIDFKIDLAALGT